MQEVPLVAHDNQVSPRVSCVMDDHLGGMPREERRRNLQTPTSGAGTHLVQYPGEVSLALIDHLVDLSDGGRKARQWPLHPKNLDAPLCALGEVERRLERMEGGSRAVTGDQDLLESAQP